MPRWAIKTALGRKTNNKTMMKKSELMENDTKAADLVIENSARASNEAFEVLAAIKDGDITLAEASEMSNAIGKINGANGNIIKAALLKMTKERQVEQGRKLIMEGAE